MEVRSTKMMPFSRKKKPHKIISAGIWHHVGFPKPFAETVAAITAHQRWGRVLLLLPPQGKEQSPGPATPRWSGNLRSGKCLYLPE